MSLWCSRLLTAINPESGTISYSYTNGNVLQKTSPAPNQTGAATQTISYCYDALNRVTGKAYSAQACPLSSPVVRYSYDGGTNGVGHLTSLTDQAGSGSYTYDALGRIANESRTITGTQKSLAYTYNLDGSVATLTYPSGAMVTYTPDSAGRMLSAVDNGNNISYVTGATYGPDSGLTGFVSGASSSFAGITNSFSYNNRLQPINMSASSPSATVFSIGYDFHLGNGDNGNVYGITNYRDTSRNQAFTYDALNRLTSAQNAGADCTKTTVNGKTEYWGNSYGYDAWGNLLQKTVTKCGAENLSVSALANNQLVGYSYDTAGNMTHDASSGLNYSFESENRITGAAGYTYTYDAAGNRVEKSNGTTGTIYWYMSPGIVTESDLSGNLTAEYVFFNGRRTARRDFPGGAVSYYFSDELKTASVITDSTGTTKEDEDYYPWGGELQFVNNDSNKYKFGGNERDNETGLDRMGVRYYSNPLSRFTTPDPLMIQKQKLADPQQWNMYQYARDNPLRFSDPTGKAVQLSNDDKERARQLAAFQKAVGKDAGKYLYDNTDKKGNHYLGVYKGGPDGKGPDFNKVNAAANKLNGIIQDSRIATVQTVQPGFVTPRGHVVDKIGSGSPATSHIEANSATIYVTSGSLGTFPGVLSSDGLSRDADLSDIFSHEIGHIDSKWFHSDVDTNGDSVRMENQTRQLNGEPLRIGHGTPHDVQLTGGSY